MTATPVKLLALLDGLPGRLAAGDPDVVRPLASLTGDVGAALVFGAGGRPLRHDPAALAIALSVRLPGWPILAVSDGRGDHPYNAARRFLSVDHLSGGRSGVVFRGDGSAAGHTAERTAERIRVIRALWNSWPIESLVADRDAGVYANTDVIRAVDHRGADFTVYGALNTPTSPQGEPVSLWHVSTAEELDAAHGLVDLVVLEDPGLYRRWAASSPDGRPGLVTALGLAHDGDATAELIPVRTPRELADALAGIPAAARIPTAARSGAVPGSAGPSLRTVLGLPPRSYDLTDKPLAFGAHHA